MSGKNLKEPSRHIFAVIAIAMSILMGLSAVPWSRLTGNRLKDFNLFEDLVPSERSITPTTTVTVDPELESLLAETETETPEKLPAEAPPAEAESAPTEPMPVYEHEEAPRDEIGDVLLECYCESPLARFKTALAGGKARIAVLGDSFIEGDIFTQDLRCLLQETYGGNGVGYVTMHTDFPGFRSSVQQSGSGWKMYDLHTLGAHDTLRTISGEYGKAEISASATYKGAKGRAHVDSWECSRFMFISPDSGTVTLTTDAGPKSYLIAPSGKVQLLEADGATSLFNIETDIEGLIGLGVYLDGISGVQVDCISIRGNSGIGHRKMSMPLAAQMREHVDYDLIVLEYGINALSSEQTDYTSYGTVMKRTVKRIKACYPEADIIIMGIADRGAKGGSEVLSLPTCQAMIKAQRDVARSTGSIFWDTREAMGGNGAIVEWRRRKLMNADYIHINHDGGRELARLFHKSLSKAINE